MEIKIYVTEFTIIIIILYATVGTQLVTSTYFIIDYLKTSENFGKVRFWSKPKALRWEDCGTVILLQQRHHISLLAVILQVTIPHAEKMTASRGLFQVQNRNINTAVLCSSSGTQTWKHHCGKVNVHIWPKIYQLDYQVFFNCVYKSFFYVCMLIKDIR